MAKKYDVEEVDCELDIRENIDHHIRAWKFRNAGVVFMLLFVLSALLGLFGNGPLSNRTRTNNNDTLQFEYFTRYQSNTAIDLKLHNINGTAYIAFPQDYLKNFQIETIFPEPNESRIANDTVVYLFKTAENGSIRFYLMPQQTGSIKGTIAVNEKIFDLSHFIFP